MVQTLENIPRLQSIPLIYDIKRDLTNITNILLIDQSVASYDTFVKSSNATTFPIVYNRQSTREELRTLLKSKFTSINRIGFVSHYSPNPYFLENETLFTTLESGLASLSSNSLLIVDLIKTLNVSNVDFLACDTLLYENWKSFYGQLKTNCPQVTIGASNNKTGNLQVGGDWILENTKENIQSIYFGETILEYNELLVTFQTNNGNLTLTYTVTSGNATITQLNTGSGSGVLNIPDNIPDITPLIPITIIDVYAFMNSTNLTSVIIGNSVTSIGDYAFASCTGLTSVTIGNSVTSIGNGAFQSCIGLSSFTVDSANPNYSVIDGVLFNKLKTILVNYPPNKTGINYNIPDSVTSIGDYAFASCTGLTSVTIGNSVTSIGDGAFQSCTGLTSVYFYGNIPSIGVNNFVSNTQDTAYYLSNTGIANLTMFTSTSPFTPIATTLNVLIGGITVSTTTGIAGSFQQISMQRLLANGQAIDISNFSPYRYASSNPLIASISNSGLINFVATGTITIIVSQSAYQDYPYISNTIQVSVSVSVPALSSICFPVGTLIDTDQGKIAIELIEKDVNTIRCKKVKAITETVSMLEYLVYIEKDALGKSIPSIDTIISPNHKLLYNREMIESRYLINRLEGVYPIKYSGEVLYNVLLERYDKMMVNNLIVETLDPENIIAQMYSNKFSKEKREYLIKKYNNFIKTKSIRDYVELSKYLK